MLFILGLGLVFNVLSWLVFVLDVLFGICLLVFCWGILTFMGLCVVLDCRSG